MWTPSPAFTLGDGETVERLVGVRASPRLDRPREADALWSPDAGTGRAHRPAWLAAHVEWGPGRHEDGFGLRASDEVESPAGFAAWVARLAEESDQATPLAAGRVRCTYRWIVEDRQVLGGIALRHQLDDFLLRVGGHIGYGIRPSARRRGLATWALGRMLGEARGLGLDRVLITCEAGNVASARTIERHGGVLDDIRDTELGATRRYWITL